MRLKYVLAPVEFIRPNIVNEAKKLIKSYQQEGWTMEEIAISLYTQLDLAHDMMAAEEMMSIEEIEETSPEQQQVPHTRKKKPKGF